VRRAQIVLLSAAGLGTAAISDELGCSKQTVLTWRERYRTEGMAGLHLAPPVRLLAVLTGEPLTGEPLTGEPWSGEPLAGGAPPVPVRRRPGIGTGSVGSTSAGSARWRAGSARSSTGSPHWVPSG
jgi:hypothetical protein